MKRLAAVISFALFIAAFLPALPAHAACFKPPGNAGDLNYNGGSRTIEYCDGGSWVNTSGAANTANGLVGWWKLDDGSGTSAADSSGNGNTGTLQNSPTWTTSGMNGGALTFNGTGAEDVGTNTSGQTYFDQVPFTASLWANYSVLPSVGPPSGGMFLMFGALISAPWESWSLWSGSDNKIYFEVLDSSQTGHEVISDSTISTGQWYLVTATIDSSYNMYLYINGVKQSTTVNAGSIYSATTYIAISGSSNPFNGTIDDVRIYNRALSMADVMALYSSTGGTSGDIYTGLTAYWKFDESSGTSATDSSGSGNTGTLTNGPVWTTGGMVNGALTFDGVNDYVSAVNPALLGTGAATVSAWYYYTGSTANNAPLYTENAGASVMFTNHGVGQTWTFSNDGGATQATAATGIFQPNQWQQVTVVRNSSGQATFYINGVQSGSANQNAGTPSISTWPYGFYIGACCGGYQWAGQIDEFRIYSRALSALDVQTLYNTTATSCAGPLGYAGDMRYNAGSYRVMQFCNGTNWIPMGKVPGTGGAGCSSPTGGQGTLVYTSAYRAMQYCDGAVWRSLGWVTPISGLVGWWNFDEGSGTSAADSSGNGNTGTLQNTPTWTTSGKINGALTFAAGTDAVSIPGPTLTNTFTFAAWVFITTNRTYSALFDQDNNLGIFLHSNVLDFCCNGSPVDKQANTTVPLNTWHQVAMVNNAGSVTFYFDGVPDGTATSVSGFSAAEIGNDPVNEAVFGTMDDVRVYNRALSASEVWRLYNGAP